MAIGLQNTDNVDAPDSDYPFGKVRDNDGSGNGTPANTKTLGDFHQFFAKILDAAGIVANGLPDNDYSGFQYFEALLALNGGCLVRTFDIGDWNMDADLSVTVNLPAGITRNQIRNISVEIRSDDLAGEYQCYPLSFGAGTMGGLHETSNVVVPADTIKLIRTAAGFFDNNQFDSVGYNRGWITVRYEP